MNKQQAIREMLWEVADRVGKKYPELKFGIRVEARPDVWRLKIYEYGGDGTRNASVTNPVEGQAKGVATEGAATADIFDKLKKISSAIPESEWDKVPTDLAETDAITLDSQPLLTFDEYCRNKENTCSCSFLNIQDSGCWKYQVDIVNIATGGAFAPYYFHRCPQCKKEYPGGLALIGRK